MKAGVTFANTSQTEPLVVLRYFGPEVNPNAPAMGAHKQKGRTLTEEILPRHREDLAELLSFMPLDRLIRLAALLDRLKRGLTTERHGPRPSRRRAHVRRPALTQSRSSGNGAARR